MKTHKLNRQFNEDSRKHERAHTASGMWVSWTVDSRTLVSRVRDLSLGGVFITTPDPASLEDTVKLLFSPQEGEIRAIGTVRYSKKGEGMGVRFSGIAQRDMARLRSMVKRLLLLEGT